MKLIRKISVGKGGKKPFKSAKPAFNMLNGLSKTHKNKPIAIKKIATTK